MTNNILLEIKDLHTHYQLDDRVVKSVDGVSFAVPMGRTVCIVGESGSGKSVTARSIMGLIDKPGRIVAGNVLWHGRPPASGKGKIAPGSSRETVLGEQAIDLARFGSTSEQLRRMRGPEISMVFQEPMASFSPMYTIGDQLVEAIRLHVEIGKSDAWKMAIGLLDRVGIKRPEERMRSYSFQLSGGMCQRAMIAVALCCSPALLIADEPTTALDVTTQARILDLLRSLQQENGMSMLFITHDLGVVAEIADEVVVMRYGKVVETGPVDAIFHDPKHPYTQQLLAAVPKMTRFDVQPEDA
ncbi:ABC transporter ATP-binding protein [Devosia nitrariae]|uniref:Dipeptide/oligopeptide/nickel ABC transporter ATP-binding protein n=1 Tax=Devosia nitrariae TaxID=2071872 RepID=A0ABQ5W9E1_9HYPH|nr:ABC transporter ATP-binding protein [Devosia nitrariae]GLQ56170.1 dipeptide/oligopeptide/nickel ABC transporter ATP-binding protein [Devosia nitrariae]